MEWSELKFWVPKAPCAEMTSSRQDRAASCTHNVWSFQGKGDNGDSTQMTDLTWAGGHHGAFSVALGTLILKDMLVKAGRPSGPAESGEQSEERGALRHDPLEDFPPPPPLFASHIRMKTWLNSGSPGKMGFPLNIQISHERRVDCVSVQRQIVHTLMCWLVSPLHTSSLGSAWTWLPLLELSMLVQDSLKSE